MKLLTNRICTLALKEVGAFFAQLLPTFVEKGNFFSNYQYSTSITIGKYC